jgi:ABC-type antimicrobial peptide transport system permease subunit
VPLDDRLLQDYFLLPSVMVEGRALNETDTNGAMISFKLLEYFGNPEVGDTIMLKDVPVTLVGVFYGSNVAEQKNTYLDWKTARDFGVKYATTETGSTTLPIGPGGGIGGGGIIQIGQSLSLRVYVDSADNIEAVAAAIESANSGLTVRTPRDNQGGSGGQFPQNIVQTQEQQITRIQQQAQQQIAALQENADTQITEMSADVTAQKAQTQTDAAAQKEQAQAAADSQISALETDQARIESMGMLISVIAAAAGTLIIFGIMFYTLRERTREIGIYKALGFSNLQATFKFMLEGSYIGILGGILGVGLALFSYSLLVDTLLKIDNAGSLPTSYLLLGMALAVGVATIGSLYPAWQASRISPLVALKNDK